MGDRERYLMRVKERKRVCLMPKSNLLTSEEIFKLAKLFVQVEGQRERERER